jgi:hypothetical protein
MRGSLATTAAAPGTAGIYKIAAKASSASIFGDLSVGDWYITEVAPTPGTGDTAYKFTPVRAGDVVGSTLTISADEVDVTVQDDDTKMYRRGKFDASGTISVIFKKLTTDAVDGFMTSFFSIATISSAGVVTSVAERNDDPYIIVLYLDEDDASGTYKVCTVFEANVFNFDYKGNSSEAVTWDMNFRLNGSSNLYLYKVANAT